MHNAVMPSSDDTVLDSACFHCGLPVPAGTHFFAKVFNKPQAMCCLGCQSVAESIVDNGLEDYYKHRTELPKTADDLVPEALRQLSLYDHPEVQKSFVMAAEGDINAQIAAERCILSSPGVATSTDDSFAVSANLRTGDSRSTTELEMWKAIIPAGFKCCR